MKKKLPLLFLTIAIVFPAFSQRIFKDIAQGTDNAWIFNSGSFSSDDTLYFNADTVNGYGYSYKYYRTKGTSGTTIDLKYDDLLRNVNMWSTTAYHKYKGAIYGNNNGQIFRIKNDSVKFVMNLSDSYRLGFFDLNNQLFFLSYNSSTQILELRRINPDITTNLIKSIYLPDPLSQYGQNTGFTLGNKFYYPLNINGLYLMSTDGTPEGTTLFQNNRFVDLSYLSLGSYAYFQKSEGGPFWYRYKLWKSKGDSLSTQKVINSIDGDETYGVYSIFKFRNNLYMLAYVNNQSRISRLDTNSSTVTHVSNAFNMYGNMLTAKNKIYYASRENDIVNIYENDGDISSERIIASIPAIDAGPTFIMAGETKVYFGQQKNNGGVPEGDAVYWVYDGFTVKKITDLKPDIILGSISNVVNVAGDIFYFSASDSQHGYELWKTDGTAIGTYLLRDINTKSASSFARPLFSVGNYAYFMADDISHGYEIWRTDGVNTFLYADLNYVNGNTHVPSSTYRSHQKFGNSYVADINYTHYQFTPDGNMKDLSFAPFYYFSIPHEYKNLLYFMGTDGNLWNTDCTIAGTKKAVHLDSTGNGTGNWGANDLIKVDTLLYFTSNSGSVLWKTNGKKNGTTKLFTFLSGNTTNVQHSYLYPFATEKIFYFLRLIEPYTSKYELWASNGTASGTLKLPTDNFFSVLGTLNNKIYFTNNNSLWQSDGTIAGTFQIDERSFSGCIKLRDKLYLSLINDFTVEYYELDKNNTIHYLNSITSPSNSGPIGFSGFSKLDERFILNSITDFNPQEEHFYITDGNAENIKKAFLLKKAFPNIGGYNFLFHNKKIYFSAVDTLKGQELWVLDFDCPDGYTVRDNITKDSTIVYGKNIWGQSIISNNKTITYDAKNGIILQPGFEVQKGTVFKTKMIGCTNTYTTNAIEDSSPSKNEPLVKINNSKRYPQLIDFLNYYPNKSLKDTYEQAERNKLVPITSQIVTGNDVYRLDLKIGSSILSGFLPKKN
ncbi:3-coathanger stack domain-containing protein [Emticicia sp. BO119]|uniref:3-coathanger stack domain-containing protein n=1 Tax=Emticicia sp. BO119 TaxID=2757768 RepID=UPI0015F0251C|nr:3-coathanger stack domain-containing protein [Emticicia sp. BO119]MBA4849987.1 hypothetical protein [Emticicia sp. BO119]